MLFRSWLQTDAEGGWDDEEEGKLLGQRMTEIPVAVDYGQRTGFMRSEPSFLDLALENIKHYQVRSDRDTNLHVTSIPILTTFGVEAKKLQTVTVGSAMGLAFSGSRTEQGAEYVEPVGSGLQYTREELLDIEKRMAALGLSALERQTRTAETEEAKRLDQKSQDSELAAQVRATGDALEEALRFTAMWMGEKDGGSVEMNTEFDEQVMSPELFDKYLKAVGEGHLSAETMWDRLVAGNLLPPDFSPALERERIDLQGVDEVAAMAEASRRARMEMEDKEADEPEETEEEEDEGDEEEQG